MTTDTGVLAALALATVILQILVVRKLYTLIDFMDMAIDSLNDIVEGLAELEDDEAEEN
jgi:hypothetical protein